MRFPVSPLEQNTVPWSNGTTPGLHPGNDGSTPSGTTFAQVRQLAERHGLNPSGCGFDSGPWALIDTAR